MTHPLLCRVNLPRDAFAWNYHMLESALLQRIVQPKHGRLVLFGDWPGLGEREGPGTALVGTRFKQDTELQYAPGIAARAPLSALYVDLWPLFCNGRVTPEQATDEVHGCSRTLPGTQTVSVYRDLHHLSLAYLCDAINP